MDIGYEFKLKFFIMFIINVQASEDERKLLTNLFKTYNKGVRPVLDSNETVVVRIKHTIQQILEVDERKELFHSCGWSSLRWNDAYLSWNPKRYNGIKSLNISPIKIWIPDIILYDAISSDQIFAGSGGQTRNLLTIDYLGNVIWGLRATFVTKCHFNIHDFPFDTQSCPFRYGSWSYEKGRIDISPQSQIKVEYSAVHNGWTLLNFSSQMSAKTYTGETYESIVFSLVFKRTALCRSLNLLLPPLIVGILVLLTFMLPAASGERLTLSVTLLLAMIFFMVGVTHLIPGDDSSMPLIYKFFMATLGQIVFLLIVLIFAMQLHDKKSYDPPMSQWIRNMILDRLSYWIGIRVDPDGGLINCSDNEELESIDKDCFEHCDTCDVDTVQMANNKMEENGDHQSTNHVIRKKELILMEWRIVALTVDRCLFLLFTSSFVITICIFFISATLG